MRKRIKDKKKGLLKKVWKFEILKDKMLFIELIMNLKVMVGLQPI